MKELIERLKTHGVCGVHIALSHSECLQIAAALERTTYPPFVQAVLLLLESTAVPEDHVAVDHNSDVMAYKYKPVFLEKCWYSSGSPVFHCLGRLPMRCDKPETLLFHRTATGWEWVLKPAQQ